MTILVNKKNEWEPVVRIGIDEISLRKGQQDFVTVISDIDRSILLDVIDSHQQDEIIETLIEQPLDIREAVTEVSVDMWGGFPKVIAAVFPNARIVFDRFHVMKAVNDELNQLRRELGITDRHSKYLLLKNYEELTDEQKQRLEGVLQRSPCLRIAHELKEEFRRIYETSRTVQSGRKRFEKWLRIAQVFYVNSAATIRRHLEGICNYFLNRTTSGVVEGINNRIKLIKRQGYGFSNFGNFRARLLACLSH